MREGRGGCNAKTVNRDGKPSGRGTLNQMQITTSAGGSKTSKERRLLDQHGSTKGPCSAQCNIAEQTNAQTELRSTVVECLARRTLDFCVCDLDDLRSWRDQNPETLALIWSGGPDKHNAVIKFAKYLNHPT